MSRNSAILLVFAASALAGCADYLNRYDTVTLAAGDAQKYNAMLQTKDPFNPASDNTAITTDGGRASDAVVHKHKRVMLPGAAPPPVTINIGTN
ncbi:hypothetical protein [Mesorhizobium sp. KR9-304]|uniref:hypothetical protein n=1 Tax=Mesorhizobium sp. KR9-304 TaxID=3156614 RepID=UPI0032B433BA